MPRTRDAQLEDRILAAAYRLWKAGGEKSLTMRAVARAARTTTPTVYQRFRDKRDMLELLRRQAQLDLFAAVRSTASLEQFCERYLDFALSHPHEYELIHADWAVRLAREEPRPAFELLKHRLAARAGGSPSSHVTLALSLAALAHGTATLLLTRGISHKVATDLRHACITGFETLIACAPGAPGSGKIRALVKRRKKEGRVAKPAPRTN